MSKMVRLNDEQVKLLEDVKSLAEKETGFTVLYNSIIANGLLLAKQELKKRLKK